MTTRDGTARGAPRSGRDATRATRDGALPGLGAAPTGRSRGLLIAGILLLAAGFGLGYPELAVLGVAALAGVTVAVAHACWRPALTVARRVTPDRVSRGESCQVRVTVRHAGRRQVTLVAYERCGDGAVPLLLRLRPGQAHEVGYQVPTDHRGVITVGPLRVSRRDPFGLFVRSWQYGGSDRVWVHPRAHPLVAVPTGAARSLDGLVDRVPHGSVTFDSLREYVRGDELRHVHWRTTARLGTLMVREHVDTSRPGLVILLDNRAGAYRDPPAFEDACDAAASIVMAAVRESLPVHLVLVGEGHRPGTPATATHTTATHTTATHTTASPTARLDRAWARGLLDRLAEAEPAVPDAPAMVAPVSATAPGPPDDPREPGAPPGGTVALSRVARELGRRPLGDTLIYLTGSGRPADLACIAGIRSRYAGAAAIVFAPPDDGSGVAAPIPAGTPATALPAFTVVDAAEFAALWDGGRPW